MLAVVAITCMFVLVKVTTEEGKQKAQEANATYFETSAKTGENVMSTFLKMVRFCNISPSAMLLASSLRQINK